MYLMTFANTFPHSETITSNDRSVREDLKLEFNIDDERMNRLRESLKN